ncbi:MAG: DUF5615 family PIN-like protein [Candidatus Heimdallarchaeota archaeon]
MKFLVDMALSPRTANFLRNKGYEAVRVNEVISGKRIEDRAVFHYAIENDYCIITADLDFAMILAFTKSQKPSTVILRVEDQRVENVNQILAEILPKVKEEILSGSIIVIEENRFRIRPLPV